MSSPLSSQFAPKFRVAICGAGITGLVLAITIGKYDQSIPIDIYEAHDSIETPGVGIGLWKQVHNILTELGLFDEFQQVFTASEDGSGPVARRSDIPEGGYVWFRRENTSSAMHRQHMIAILERHLPGSCTVHLKKRLVDYTELVEQDAPSIRLEFADGTTTTTDLLVGADGIRSAVRKTFFETASKDQKIDYREYIDAIFTGTSMYRFVIPANALRKECPESDSLKSTVVYTGKGKYLIAYPIARGSLINAAAVINDPTLEGTYYQGHWVSETTPDEIVGLFHDFEPEVKAVMKFCENPSKWALNIIKPLPFCVGKTVALIGDACHAMTPYTGGGAGQGINDAFVLGRLIAHPLATRSRIPDILRIYEGICLPFAQTVANLSLSVGRLFLFTEPGCYDGSRREDDLDDRGISAYEREGMEALKQKILGCWEWIGEAKGGVDEWAEAELKLQALIAEGM